MTLPPLELPSEQELLLKIRQRVDEIKARADLPRYKYADTEQAKIIAHFLERAIQIGEACFRANELAVPLNILDRVLCDDLIRLFWVSLSSSNASEYAKVAIAELHKMIRICLDAGYGKVFNTATGQDMSTAVLQKIQDQKLKAKSIEQIAKNCGLEKVYAIPFRFTSLAVHGNTFELQRLVSAESAPSALAAVVVLLRAIALIADNFPDRTIGAGDVLRTLGLDRLGRTGARDNPPPPR